MKSNIFKWLVIILTIHVFSVMAGLLHGLNGKNESFWLAVVFAASYSIASAFVVYIANQKWLIFSYAIADGIGVFFYYFAFTPQWIISVYFCLYTFGLIASTIYIQTKQTRKRNGKSTKSIPENKTSRTTPERGVTYQKNGDIRPSKRRRASSGENKPAIG